MRTSFSRVRAAHAPFIQIIRTGWIDFFEGPGEPQGAVHDADHRSWTPDLVQCSVGAAAIRTPVKPAQQRPGDLPSDTAGGEQLEGTDGILENRVHTGSLG
jgi:hypothetical protein